MLIRDEIVLAFRRVAEAQGQRLAPLTDELKLTECGLDSVGFMLVVSSCVPAHVTAVPPHWATASFRCLLVDLVRR